MLMYEDALVSSFFYRQESHECIGMLLHFTTHLQSPPLGTLKLTLRLE